MKQGATARATFLYDAVGDLTLQRDGRNQWLYFEYDALDRLVKKRQDSAAGPVIAEYLFDATGQKGLLSRSKAYTAQGTVEIYNVTFDVRSRLTQQNWIVPGTGGGTFRLDHSYNAADQPATLRYPGGTGGQQGELVTTGYNALSQLNSVSGSGVSYVSSTTYNARGQVTEQRLDTGSNGLTRQYIYDSNTMRLTTLRAGVSSPYTNLQNLSYTYDAAGNVASIVDGVNSSQRQCFGYDALDRLSNAFTGNAGCTAYATGGTGPYNHTYVYDAIGNLTSYAGNLYTYGDSAHKHAVTAAYGNTYGYDGNGNQTTRTIAGTTYTFVFDYENRLTEVKQGTTSLATFLYDADGTRVKGTVSGTNTVYIAGIYERQGAAYTSYYEGGGLRRSGYASNNGVFYMLSDHLKSTSALVARNGVLNVKYFYYPYGARRGVPFNTITAKHFTGQYHETSLPGGEGLSFYNARWYDPKLGRFLSADMIVPNAANPQSLNRYAYVLGNPLKFIDPTGHMVACSAAGEGCGGGHGARPNPPRATGTTSTPASTPMATRSPAPTPSGCRSVVCLPTSTPTVTPTSTWIPGPRMVGVSPTPTPTGTATPWPYAPRPGSINVPDLEWSLWVFVEEDIARLSVKYGPKMVRAGGRAYGGSPLAPGISQAVGVLTSVGPNAIGHYQSDGLAMFSDVDFYTDAIVDVIGFGTSTLSGWALAGVGGWLGAPIEGVGALPGAAAGYLAGSIGGSLLYDAVIGPHLVSPWVYDKVTAVAGWLQ